MACLSKERNSSYRIHWKFKAKLGPRAGETFEGSLHGLLHQDRRQSQTTRNRGV